MRLPSKRTLDAAWNQAANVDPWWALIGVATVWTGLALATRKKPSPSPLPYITVAQRDAWFGPIVAEPAPTANDPQAVRITNGFDKVKQFDFPDLIGVSGVPASGKLWLHEKAGPALQAVVKELKSKGLLQNIKSFNGSYVPRYVRRIDGTKSTNLSSHSYGTSIDINASTNGQGKEPTAEQVAMVPTFEKHGFYWGQHFSTRDPMHFEYVKKPA